MLTQLVILIFLFYTARPPGADSGLTVKSSSTSNASANKAIGRCPVECQDARPTFFHCHNTAASRRSVYLARKLFRCRVRLPLLKRCREVYTRFISGADRRIRFVSGRCACSWRCHPSPQFAHVLASTHTFPWWTAMHGTTSSGTKRIISHGTASYVIISYNMTSYETTSCGPCGMLSHRRIVSSTCLEECSQGSS